MIKENMSYKIEMHLHVKGTSSCAKLAAENIIPAYKKAGYSGIVCTNHLNKATWHYLKGFRTTTKIQSYLKAFDSLNDLGTKNGIKIYFGMELALGKEYYSGSKNDCAEMLVYGITREDFIKYNKHLMNFSHIEFHNLAKNNGWVVIQSHPFRPHSKQLTKADVDGVEVYNSHPGHNSHNDLALQYAINNDFIGTSGSDFHYENMEGSGITCDALPNNEHELASLLKSRNFKVSHKN